MNDIHQTRIKNNVKLEIGGVHLSAILTLAMGFVNLISAVQPALESRLLIIREIIPLVVRQGSRITSTLAGFALILLAASLWRRKRIAWIITILLLSVSMITHLVKGLDFEEASLTLGLILLLVILRRSFHAITDPPSLKQGLIVLAAAFLFTLLYGGAGFFLLDRHFAVKFGLLDSLRQTVVMFTSFYNPGLEPLTGFGRYFADSIYIIGLTTLGFALIMIIRPVLVRRLASPEERQKASLIVHKFGRTALARPALFEDKSYFFGPGESVIAYAVSGHGAIALGDPICAPQDAPGAIKAFSDFCVHNDWTPCFVSTLPDYLDHYRAAHFDTLCIGYEAIVGLEIFSLEGKENKDLRYAVNRLEREGYTAIVHDPPHSKELVDALWNISDAWLNLHHGGEMHFSDGWFNEPYIQSSSLIVVHGADGSPTAFANLVEEYQKNEMTIDLMRHYPKVEYGTMEFLFVKFLQWAKEKGYTSFSLGLSAIVGVGEKPEDPRVEKALHTLSEYVSRFYNFKGLHAFKEKFHPQWEPRYLVYQGVTSLPTILNSLLRVHSGNNFLWNFIKN